MAIEWGQISSFERFDKLKLSKGDKAKVVFEDDGNFVSAKILKQADVKYPRDSYVFVVSTNNSKKEFWVSSNTFSVMRQLKILREQNNGSLKGVRAAIERVSDEPTETNYQITGE